MRRAGFTWPHRIPATLCLFAFFATLAARTGSWELGPMHDQAGARAAVLAGAFCLRLESRIVSAAHLAALGARQCAEPCLGHPVRRGHQDGHLRDCAFQRLAARADGGGMDGGGAWRAERRPGRSLRARPARPQAPAGLSQRRKHRHHPHRSGVRNGGGGAGTCGLGTPGNGGRLCCTFGTTASSNHCCFWAPVRWFTPRARAK